ncbi:MAG: hypothetical protein WCP41_09365, partial [Verrucomicrobiota bacterium]
IGACQGQRDHCHRQDLIFIRKQASEKRRVRLRGSRSPQGGTALQEQGAVNSGKSRTEEYRAEALP